MNGVGVVSMSSSSVGSMSSSSVGPASEYSNCFAAAVVLPPVDHAHPGRGLEAEGLSRVGAGRRLSVDAGLPQRSPSPSAPRPRRLSVDAGLPQRSTNRFNKSGWIKKQGAGRRKFIGRKSKSSEPSPGPWS